MMAGVHRDIRQYFKHSISRTEEKEIPETEQQQQNQQRPIK